METILLIAVKCNVLYKQVSGKSASYPDLESYHNPKPKLDSPTPTHLHSQLFPNYSPEYHLLPKFPTYVIPSSLTLLEIRKLNSTTRFTEKMETMDMMMFSLLFIVIIVSTPVPELVNFVENTWGKIAVKGCKDLYVSAYYHPHTDDMH